MYINPTVMAFIAAHHQVEVDNQVEKLLKHGKSGILSLLSIATVTKRSFLPEHFGQFYLPWYRSEWPGEAWWEPTASPIMVRDYEVRDDDDREKRRILLRNNLHEFGPSIAVEDTSLGVTIIVDGAKRVSVAYQEGIKWGFLILRSDYAHMLYPSDFFPHVRLTL